MKVIYLETSALLSVLFNEDGSENINRTIEEQDKITSSSLTLVEARRVIVRLLDDKFIKEAESKSLTGLLYNASNSWDILQITDDVQKRAGERFPSEPVRTLDAIHLASALELKSVYPGLKVLSLDQKIINNLEPLGLERV